MSFSVAINLPPPPAQPPTQKTFFLTSDNSHRIVLNELGSHVGCRRVSFLGTLSKFFVMNYHDKVRRVQYLLVFRLISSYTGERLIPGMRRKDWILRALFLEVSLWPHNVGSRDEIYSAR